MSRRQVFGKPPPGAGQARRVKERWLKEMENPFMFKAAADERTRGKRRLLYAATAAALLIIFTAGVLTVYVNCYNILHAEPMEVFGIYLTDDGAGVILFNKFFMLW